MWGLEDFRVWFAVLAYQTWCGQHGYCAKQRWRSSAQARRCAGLRARHDRCAHRSEGVTYVQDGYFSAAQTDAVLRHERSRRRDWFSWPWACPGRSSSSTSMAMNWAPRCALASEPCSIFSGSMLRAPWLVRRLGMEWLFRLMMEPLRPFRRYVLGNPQFLAGVMWRRMRSRMALTQGPLSG